MNHAPGQARRCVSDPTPNFQRSLGGKPSCGIFGRDVPVHGAESVSGAVIGAGN
jgi:hypothetical protein